MLFAKPQGMCSWNFFLEGEGHHASLTFNTFGEQGAIFADGASFEVQKQGLFSGQWTLDDSGRQLATARKLSAFTRTFEIQTIDGLLDLRAESPFGRTFRMEHEENVIATIAPVHAFTRRATIEVHAPQADFLQIAFSFWLVAIVWRRAANNGGGGAAG